MSVHTKKRLWLADLEPKHSYSVLLQYNDVLLKNHLLFGHQVLMGVAYLSVSLDVAKRFRPDQVLRLEKIIFSNALKLNPNESCYIVSKINTQSTLQKIETTYKVSETEQTTSACSANFIENHVDCLQKTVDISELINNAIEVVSADTFYQDKNQTCYGPALFSVNRVYKMHDLIILGEIQLSQDIENELHTYTIHPAVLDACHVVSSFCGTGKPYSNHRIPLIIKAVTLTSYIKSHDLKHCFCMVVPKVNNPEISEFDITLYSIKGEQIIIMEGFTTKTLKDKQNLLGADVPTSQPLKPTAQYSTITGDSLELKIKGYLQNKIAPIINTTPDKVSTKSNYMDMGLDSNNMISAILEIEKEVGIELFPTLFFEHQNISALSKHFSIDNQQDFENYFGQSPAPIDPAYDLPAKPVTQTNNDPTDKAIGSDYDDIAIIGMSGYLPDSENFEEFWQHLKYSHDLVKEVPDNHWDYRPWYSKDPQAANKTYAKWGGFVKDIDKFDSMFFGISPRQADWMDPQLRLLLQSVHSTFEDAGVINEVAGSYTGVYVGCCFQEYWDEIVRTEQPFIDYQAHSAALSSLTGTISYTYDLQGPSIPLDNACASSLTALHLACESMKRGECEQAIVAGVNALLSPLHYVYFSRLKALSPTGRCHTFDAKADGYVPGEGVVSVLVKPLKKALRDNNHIYGVIKSSAINHTGRANNPYAPRPELQTKLLLEAWRCAGIHPRDIGYIEAHGTGTSLGDPIEVNALKKAFKEFTRDENFCALGSAKAHMGHLEGAAGLASVVKVLLMMKNKLIPRMPNFTAINPYIKLEKSPFYINTEATEWLSVGDKKRLAGVSSFGMTGNNAHVVLEEFIAPKADEIDCEKYLLPVSAMNTKQLSVYIEQLITFLNKKNDQINCADIAYTYQMARKPQPIRLMICFKTINSLLDHLRTALTNTDNLTDIYRGEVTEDKEDAIPIRFEGSYQSIAASWVSGYTVEWHTLYEGLVPSIISAPTYPFQKRRHWFPTDISIPDTSLDAADANHVKILNADDSYLKDHVVHTDRVLPGAYCVEFAYAVLSKTYPDSLITIQNMVWLKPIKLNHGTATIHAELNKRNRINKFSLSINSEIYANGQFSLDVNRFSEAAGFSKEALVAGAKKIFEKSQIYKTFSELGLHYGRTFQCIQHVYVTSNQLLSEVVYDAQDIDTFDAESDLKSNLLDAAFQSIIGFMLLSEAMPSTELPFLLESMQVCSAIPNHCFILVSKDEQKPSTAISKYTLHIIDEVGKTCVSMHGFSTRRLPVSTESNQLKPVMPSMKTTQTKAIKVQKQLSTLQTFLLESTANILNVETSDISMQDEMSAYGMDSITLTELINVVNDEYNLSLTPAIFFECTSLSAFSSHLTEQYPELVDAQVDNHVFTNGETEERSKSSKTVSVDIPVNTTYSDRDIAVVGLSGCFPKAADLQQFWTNLVDETDCISSIPKTHWDVAKIKDQSAIINHGGFIDTIKQFDPLFFGISPKEAESMDPQQRLLMTYVWKAIEDSGYSTHSLWGSKTGLYIATAETGYRSRVFASNHPIEGYSAAATVPSIGPNRLSFLLNLSGPSEIIETACSSSLVAIQHGMEALRTGVCDIVITGGVNTLLSPEVHESFAKAGMLSKAGRCKTFSDDADGYVRSEGVGIFVLKRLSDAVEQNDHIYGVIKGAAVNHGGRSQSLTAPNANAQADVIQQAMSDANVDVNSITYIEAHGTGTPLGDPVEINGLKKAYSQLAMQEGVALDKHYCGVSSVKSNIGHLELAAGAAGLMKALLAMQHGMLPASLHIDKVNSYIDLEDSAFYLLREKTPWTRLTNSQEQAIPRRAGISSFGFGGVNAHLVIEEYIAPPASHNEVMPVEFLIPISAKTESTRLDYVKSIHQFLINNSSIDILSLAYTLQIGRDAYEYRIAFAVKDSAKLIALMQAYLANPLIESDVIFQGRVKTTANSSQAALSFSNSTMMADAWVSGSTIDWCSLYEKQVPRISLPTYPFSTEDYWLAVEKVDVKKPTRLISYSTKVESTDLKHESIHYLKQNLSKAININYDQIDENAELEKYGIDSVMIMALTAKLEKSFGPLPKTLFFEHQTLAELAEYFMSNYQETLISLLDIDIDETEKVLEKDVEDDLPINNTPQDDIAIIGISGRYPEAVDLDEFWDNLCQGKDCITTVPSSRWNANLLYSNKPNVAGRIKSKWGGFIEGIDEFDPLFFNISPREAELMDPQERIFLQFAWSALENSGYTRERLNIPSVNRKVGVYVGVMYEEYQLYAAEQTQNGRPIGLSGSPASIANRVSYFCNLQGPSMAVDTMCSSSLTSIHLACEALRAGQIKMAIAGGVNISIHPNKYLLLSQSNFISTKGRCESFGQGGDGYIPGEGVGCVILKPLASAIADKDHIYAIIKGSSLNHGGKTNGYTVPSPKAQASVISEAIKHAAVSPDKISYIEAHGTGTSLGDPIEIAGLSSAFKRVGRADLRCVIGSVKSNIGHCESSAGIASVTKILLQLKHKQLVPSIHSRELNSHIDFDQTPFKVQQELSEWDSPVIDGVEQPRLAGISGFGAGGSNAHLIIEEYEDQKPVQPTRHKELILVSAKTNEQLHEYATALNKHIQSKSVFLADLAYTLQVGREAMDYRLAFIVSTTSQLQEALTLWLAGKTTQGITYQASNQSDNQSLAYLAADDDFIHVINEWVNRENYHILAKLWVDGFNIPWHQLTRNSRRTTSLPTYPFAKEKYWLPDISGQLSPQPKSQLGPLLDENISTLYAQRFKTLISFNTALLQDHIINENAVLPGVCLLEMAYSALLHADSNPVTGMTDIEWLTPVSPSKGPIILVTELTLQAYGIQFAISNHESEQVYCRGTFKSKSVNAEKIDIGDIKSSLTGVMSGQEVYQHFFDSGINYGESLQPIDNIAYSKTEALAKLIPTEFALKLTKDYSLNPIVMDAALQSCIGVLINQNKQAYLPVAIKKLEIIKEHVSACYIYVLFASAEEKLFNKQFDICIADAEGDICLKIQGLCLQETVLHVNQDITYAAQQWLSLNSDVREVSLEKSINVLLVDFSNQHLKHIEASGYTSATALPQLSMIDTYLSTFNWLKEFMKNLTAGSRHAWVVIKFFSADTASISGLLKSAMQENPTLKLRLIFVGDVSAVDLLETLNNERQMSDQFDVISYHTLKDRKVFVVKELVAIPHVNNHDYSNAVYWICGGLGSIGLIFAEHLAKHQDVTIVLSGRSVLSDENKATIDKLRLSMNAEIVYYQTDLALQQSVAQTHHQIKTRFKRLDGIINAAGIIKDAFILKKTETEIHDVMSPKVLGVNYLDEVSKNDELRFFIVFSSLTAAFGGVGQSDYASANVYLDTYIQQRNKQVAKGKRHGHSLSIGWPYWLSGGMHIDDASLKWMYDRFGLKPMSTMAGIQAFDLAVANSLEHLLIIAGDHKKIAETLLSPTDIDVSPVPTVHSHITTIDSTERMRQYLRQTLATKLKLSQDKIVMNAALDKYGIDSVMIVELVAELEKIFGSLSRTLFFEHPTLASLAQYFTEEHTETVNNLFNKNAKVINLNQHSQAQEKPINERKAGYRLPKSNQIVQKTSEIAIIGLSGRYPKAKNLAEFWKNLRMGRDCITEIPKSHWDADQLYSNDKNKEGVINSKWGGFIDNFDCFDPLFFNISPREAEMMDPQERLFLQCAWSTLEDAGYTRERLHANPINGNVGVYAGVMYEEYPFYAVENSMQGAPVAVSGNPANIANRVSYFCDLNGPSVSIDTMCSSSLTAIHLACESIRANESAMALAGGVNLSLHQNKYLLLSQANFLSTEGRCESFGQGGDGYVPGEGVGCVLLKLLDKAIADADPIYAVIKSSAVNHGGRTNGYTVPNPKAQEKVVRSAIAKAGVNPRSISYVEAHGTGTQLGDPIEIAGLTNAYRQGTGDSSYCAIGSVKSNIGHCESAAGISGLTKILLQMKNRELVPSIHCENLNEAIDFSQTPFTVQRTINDWQRPIVGGIEQPRVAGLSSFGAGGSNAHLIIEEYILPDRDIPIDTEVLIVLSAKSQSQLIEYARSLHNDLSINPVELTDLAYTLQMGREAMKYRLCFVSHSVKHVIEVLKNICANKSNVENLYYQGVADPENIDLIMGDGDLSRVITQWIEEGTLDKLARYWVKGIHINWGLFDQANKRMIHMPTYPFSSNRYWIPSVNSELETSNKDDDINEYDAETDWYHLIQRRLGQSVLVICDRKAVRTEFNDLFNSIANELTEVAETELFRWNISTVKEFIDSSHDVLVYVAAKALTHAEFTQILSQYQHQCGQLVIFSRKNKNTNESINKIQQTMSLYSANIRVSVYDEQDEDNIANLFVAEWLNDMSDTQPSRVISYDSDSLDVVNHGTILVKTWENSQQATAKQQAKIDGALLVLLPEHPTEEFNVSPLNALFTDGIECLAVNDYALNKLAIINFTHVLDLSIFDTLKQSNYLLHMAVYQCIIRHKTCSRVLLLSTGFQSKSNPSINGAEICGLVQVLGAEYEHIVARHIDIDTRLSDTDFLSRLVENECMNNCPYSQIVYRNGDRYTPTIQSYMSHPYSDQQLNDVFPISDSGLYIITGGTGGIGIAIAEYIIGRGAKHLLLTGNSHLPEKQDWKRIIKDPKQNSLLRHKLNSLLALETQGVTVSIYIGAIYDGSDFQVFLKNTLSTNGKVKGVIHAANASSVIADSDMRFTDKNKQNMSAVMMVKIETMRTLVRLLKDQSLDFFVSFTSTAGIFPKFMVGLSDYSAANAFVDSYSNYLNSAHRRIYHSIAWVGWSDTGAHTKNAVVKNMAEQQASQYGLLFNNKEEGKQLFEQAMMNRTSSTSLLVSYINQQQFNKNYQCLLHANTFTNREEKGADVAVSVDNILSLDLDELNDAQIESLSQQLSQVQQAESTDNESTSRIYHTIKTELMTLLKIDANSFNSQETFQHYGLDSITGTQLSLRLGNIFKIDIQPKWLIDFPTVAKLASQIESISMQDKGAVINE